MNDEIYNHEYFTTITEGWNKISYAAISSELLNDHRLKSGGNFVVDLGCGTGIYSNVLTKTDNRYIGIDMSSSALEIAKSRGVNVISGEAEAIPVADRSVDYLFSTEVIEHVISPEKMMQEIYRILKPGGCGFITTTTYQFIIFHYIWVLSEIKFKFRDIVKYPLGFLSKKHRNEFVRLLYDFTGGHLWGFMKKDLIGLVKNSSLQIDDVYYLNVQSIIPFELQGNGLKLIFRMYVDKINSIFLHKKRAFYGPNIIIKFSKQAN